ncbi:UNVERIFIED_CONTAM: dinuclear metal center YbgI/SA1388 family protein [Acetivibrio alkalicellulosi]
MSIRFKDIIKFMEIYAPSNLAEDYDNVGLIIGGRDNEIKRIMVCLDVTTKVVDKAVEKSINLIISHHPLIFKGLKRINEDDIKGEIIHKLIKNNIGVYCAHTNLDVADGGINEYLAKTLELSDIKNLKNYKTESLYKVVVFVPEESVDLVRQSMSSKGAGWIGNYSDCTFMTKGTGTFNPLEGSNPYIGSKHKLEHVEEIRLETIVPKNKLNGVINAMIKAHPYEEVAYDVYQLNMDGKSYGFGKIGMLKEPISFHDFIKSVKEKLDIKNLRVIGRVEKDIEKVAVFCGSYDEGLNHMVKSKADILVTGDVKYHNAMDMVQMEMCVIDAGHFNTEKIVVPMLVDVLSKEFSQIDIMSNNVEEDPFKIY